MKWQSTIGLILFLTGTVLLLSACSRPGPGTTPPAPGAADLYAHVRQVHYQRAGGAAQELSLSEKQVLGLNDAITVNDTGEARLLFGDYLEVMVYRQSNLAITGAPAPNAPPAYRMRLEGGSVYNTLSAQQEAERRVQIDTEWATIKAVGTGFFVHYDRSREMTWVVVEQGAATVEAGGVEVTVQAGQQSWVEPGEAPVDPLPACRNLVGEQGDLFPLIEELTGGAITDEHLLPCPEEVEPTAIPAPTRTRTPVPTGTRTPTPTGTRISTPTGTRTPRPTWTPTPTGTRTPRPTWTPTPTGTRTPAPTHTPSPTPFVSFHADPAVLQACECTTLRWDVENVIAVYLDGEGVVGHDSWTVCPTTTQTFTLRAVIATGDIVRSVTAQVLYPTVNFRADRTTLASGECTTLRWDVENVIAVYLDDEGVVGHDSRTVCPTTTQTYTLRSETWCGDQAHQVTINVRPQDTQGPTIAEVSESNDPIWYGSSGCSGDYFVTIYARMTDSAGIGGADLYYRRRGTSTWLTRAMTSIGGGWYTAGQIFADDLVPSGVYTEQTLEYHVRAWDTLGNATQSSAGTVTMQYCLY